MASSPRHWLDILDKNEELNGHGLEHTSRGFQTIVFV